MKTSLRICVILCFFMLGACEWEGYEVDEDVVDETIDTDQKFEAFTDARREAVADEAGRMFKANLAWWAYQENVEWIDGRELRDNGQLRIDVFKSDQSVDLIISADMSSFLPFPVIYNSDFRMDETADKLEIKALIQDDLSRKKITLKQENSIGSSNQAYFSFKLTTDEFKDFSPGMHNFTISIESELITFFNIRSKIHPVSAKVNMPYVVPPIFKTAIYFKKLVLNEAETKRKLGANDWNDPAPEAGVSVKYKDQSVIYEFAKNSFQLSRQTKGIAYHCSENDSLTIKVLDVDYGFNINDVIRDTVVSMKSLEGTDYYNLKMKCVDELMIYTKFLGRQN